MRRLTFQLAGVERRHVELYASPEVGAPWTKFDTPFELYQDSSGSASAGRAPTTWISASARCRRPRSEGFGCRRVFGRGPVFARVLLWRSRAAPPVWPSRCRISGRTFPKSIESDGTSLTVRLFPGQIPALHEIQGGEQKTHECFVASGRRTASRRCRSPGVVLERLRAPRRSGVSKSAAVPFLAPLDASHAALVNAADRRTSAF